MEILIGVAIGFMAWFLVHYLVAGVYTVNQNERAVKTVSGARNVSAETIKAQELAAMTEERAREIIRSLRLFAPMEPDPFNGLGLVEQQAIFHKTNLIPRAGAPNLVWDFDAHFLFCGSFFRRRVGGPLLPECERN